MASEQHYDPGKTDKPGTGDQDQSSVTPPGGGVTDTDIDARDGEADDSDSRYSDEDLLRTGGGATR